MNAPKIQNAASPPSRAAADARSGPEVQGESFGAFLIRERELRGISLDQIADETRILATNLMALEQDDRARLPERVFVLGYIRAYARAIGIDPNDAVLRYDEYLQGREPPPAMVLQLPHRKSRAGHIALAAALLALAIAVAVCLRLALGASSEGVGDAPEPDRDVRGQVQTAPGRPALSDGAAALPAMPASGRAGAGAQPASAAPSDPTSAAMAPRAPSDPQP